MIQGQYSTFIQNEVTGNKWRIYTQGNVDNKLPHGKILSLNSNEQNAKQRPLKHHGTSIKVTAGFGSSENGIWSQRDKDMDHDLAIF